MSKDDTSNPTTEKSFDVDMTEDVLAALGDPAILEELNTSVKDSELEGVSGGGGGMALIKMLAAPMTFGEGASAVTIDDAFISKTTTCTVGGRSVNNMKELRIAMHAQYKSGQTPHIRYS